MDITVDPVKILDASQSLTPAASTAVTALAIGGAVGAAAFAVSKLIGWGSSVTKLLGNHLRHDISQVADKLSDLTDESKVQTSLLHRQTDLLERQNTLLERLSEK